MDGAALDGAGAVAASAWLPAAPLLWGGAAVLAVLLAGTLAGVLLRARLPDVLPRVGSWWAIAVVLAAALAAGPTATTVLFAVVSFVALREFLSLAPTRREDRLVVLAAYLVIPVSYAAIAFDRYGLFLVLVPVWAFLLMPTLMILNGRTAGFLSSAGILHWGLMIAVYNLGHVAVLSNVAPDEAPAGGAGLVFFLLVATGLCDVFQYVVGKRFGRRKILPTISPNKTWEGFLGGMALTALLVVAIGPAFTPLAPGPLVLLAILLPLTAFAGDVTMSAIKRDLGVKDTSRLIPGHGGALDRLDSLTFTAPLAFHVIAFFSLARY